MGNKLKQVASVYKKQSRMSKYGLRSAIGNYLMFHSSPGFLSSGAWYFPRINADNANYFQSVIGVLWWTVEVGRVEITMEVSMLSSHLALPRAGHLIGAFHIFAYLEKKHNARIVFDPMYPVGSLRKVSFQPMTGRTFMAMLRKLFPQKLQCLTARISRLVVL